MVEWEPRADCVDFEPQWKNDGKEELEGLDSRALMADATTLINLSWSALHCREEALPQPTKKNSSTESDVLSDQGHRTARPSYCAYLKARASTFNVQPSYSMADLEASEDLSHHSLVRHTESGRVFVPIQAPALPQ